LRAIVPDAHIEGVAEAVTPASPLGRHIGGVDICFDCVDSFAARGALEAAVVERWNRASGEIADSIPRANLGTRGSDDGEDIPHAIVHGGVTGYYGQVVVLRPPEVGYAAVFGNDFARTEAALKPVMPHSVAIVAATQVAELLRWLVNPEEPTRARLVVLDALSADNRVIEVVV
ncbi:MAG: ThiF family adenylyltransferase, partial [Spirochaetales bacterium]|nr:ThiF family adenylyltransferase [Spirochaetales bacterium]